MKQTLPVKIFHFHNGTGGGVLSVIRNLLAYRQHPEIENHVIYTINREQIPVYKLPGLKGAVSEQVFYFSPKWNFYHTCRQLAKLLPDDKAIIVAHDWLELGMVSNLGLQNPVVHYVHGAYDYYYSLAVMHSPWIDNYIVVAQQIADELTMSLPERKSAIHYLKFPVPDFKCEENNKYSGFHVVFAGRCEDAKGYSLLPEIEKKLQIKGVRVHWHIVGEGSTDVKKQQIWPAESNIHFYGNLANEELLKLLCQVHVLILPSLAEGMPVSVIEAMKAGAVPLVNDIPGGVQELIPNGQRGFKIQNNNPEIYALHFANMYHKAWEWKRLSVEVKKYTNEHFDPKSNTGKIEDLLKDTIKRSKIKTPQKVYGSKLDEPWLPNFFVNSFRGFF
ncbi:glycosyltransferase family 4 protein [Aquiflexum sp. LQ15W]|uniref:glycosyltransferase family 4 protein n=1 Tax=Cognataquiflexum nitidum TaxID=2922272 RepID=UPI001F12FE4B|nr:glycosyltransferase family 4 protein [Cognataquiflexum nitidum]MCH6201342.1 glycosyltransferase family 4 protein [Cognataquiflexum nitidum]